MESERPEQRIRELDLHKGAIPFRSISARKEEIVEVNIDVDKQMHGQREEYNKPNKCLVVDHLTPKTLMFYVVPFLLKRRPENWSAWHISHSRIGGLLLGLLNRIMPWEIRKLDFRLVDVRDENGLLVRLRIPFGGELSYLIEEIIQETRAISWFPNSKSFWRKCLAEDLLPNTLNKSLGSSIFLIQVAAWRARGMDNCTMLMGDRAWWADLQRYAAKFGVDLVRVRGAYPSKLSQDHLVGQLQEHLSANTKARLKNLRYRWTKLGKRNRLRTARPNEHNMRTASQHEADPMPKLFAEYRGHLNLEDVHLHSDLFFWQQSSLKGEDIVVSYLSPHEPLNEEMLEQCRRHSLNVSVSHPEAAEIDDFPTFDYKPSKEVFKHSIEGRSTKAEEIFLRRQLVKYTERRDFWSQYFQSANIKLYTTWYKYDADHSIIRDVLQELGGISTVYQRAFDEMPSPGTAIDADIAFGFSKEHAAVEKCSTSDMDYFVVTGYLGDHRFTYYRSEALKLRGSLEKHGARCIVSFLDENSSDDSRWHTGHEFMRVNYQFLLEKVIENPWLGIVFKPKQPRTLRNRLGEVAQLLDQALATGRCYVFAEGDWKASCPPAAAALTSDLVIHGHCCAATAGFESALAGVPTLLLDREGWGISPLNKLGPSVVFTDWEELWRACEGLFQSEGTIDHIGDWGNLLWKYDPFRDGRAAERMGDFLRWLLEGLRDGGCRERSISNAVERYASRWGTDKVIKWHSC